MISTNSRRRRYPERTDAHARRRWALSVCTTRWRKLHVANVRRWRSGMVLSGPFQKFYTNCICLAWPGQSSLNNTVANVYTRARDMHGFLILTTVIIQVNLHVHGLYYWTSSSATAIIFLGKPSWYLHTMCSDQYFLGQRPSAPLIKFVPYSSLARHHPDVVQQQLEEDTRTNRIEDSLQLFTNICSSQLLKKASLILLLNKVHPSGYSFIICFSSRVGWSTTEEATKW